MAAGRDELGCAALHGTAAATGVSIDDMVLEKLLEVFHPTTRAGKGADVDSETTKVERAAPGADDSETGPAEAGRGW